jgi:hypothetical protein
MMSDYKKAVHWIAVNVMEDSADVAFMASISTVRLTAHIEGVEPVAVARDVIFVRAHRQHRLQMVAKELKETEAKERKAG